MLIVNINSVLISYLVENITFCFRNMAKESLLVSKTCFYVHFKNPINILILYKQSQMQGDSLLVFEFNRMRQQKNFLSK